MMNHYAKFAAMLIRMIAIFMILIGLMGLIYQFFPAHESERFGRLLSSIAFLMVGVIVYVLGKPIAQAITKDL